MSVAFTTSRFCFLNFRKNSFFFISINKIEFSLVSVSEYYNESVFVRRNMA